MLQAITQFAGPYRFLSNFWPASIEFDRRLYPSVEHAYQAAKVDPLLREPFTCGEPGVVKRMGRRATLFYPDWETRKFDVMLRCLRAKFDPVRNPTLAELLLQTGTRELIEGNTWGDRIWGQCPVGIGENHLGRLLMQVRRELQGS